MKLLFASTAVGVLALAGSAFAQDLDDPYYVELSLGSGVWGNVHANPIARITGNVPVHGDADTHAGPYVSIAAGHKFGFVGVEAEVLRRGGGLAAGGGGAAGSAGGGRGAG